MEGRGCTLDELIEDARRLADAPEQSRLSVTKKFIGKSELYTISRTPSPTFNHAKPSISKTNTYEATSSAPATPLRRAKSSTSKTDTHETYPSTSLSPLKMKVSQLSVSIPDADDEGTSIAEEGPVVLASDQAPKKIHFPPTHACGVARSTKVIEYPEGVYYKRRSGGEYIPVAVGDLVVRVRDKVERDGEVSNKWDIIDGPFRILKFDRANRIWAVDERDEGQKMDDLQYMIAKKSQFMKMQKTRVQLTLPDESHGPLWIQIADLLPCLDGLRIGCTLPSSSLAVSEMPSFIKLREVLKKENAALKGDEAAVTLRLKEEVGLYFVELKKGIFIAVIEVKNGGQGAENGLFEVERIRAKRLRRLNLNHKAVIKHGLGTDWNDPWVQRLHRECPDLFAGKVIVVQYMVHWVGWASEDDTWEFVGQKENAIPSEFINEYNKIADPLRNFRPEERLRDPMSLVFTKDLYF